MANQEALIIKDSGGTEVDVTASNALKVDNSAVVQPVSDNGGSLTIDGTVTVVDGGGSVTIDDGGSTVSIDDAGGSITVDGPLTDTELRATPVPVSATNLDIRDLTFAADKVDASGTVLGAGNNNIGDVDVVSMPSEGTVSSVNSSTATLGISGVFTGTSEDVSSYSSISVMAFANVASAVNGLSLQQSSDGTNWDITDTFTVSASAGFTVSVQVCAKFFRVVYTNGVVGQSSFRLQTLYHISRQPTSTVKPSDSMTNESDTREQLCKLMVYNGSTWDRLRGGSGTGVSATLVSAIPAGTNRIGSVRLVDSADADLTTTKGTQTSRAVGTQDLKDSGRTAVIYYATGVASGTTGTETAISLTKSSGTSATSSANSHTPTSGKRFRIEYITVATRGNTTATAQVTTFNLRINTAGAVTTTSTPIIMAIRSATPATSLAWDRVTIPIGEGYEILGDGTLQFGITANAVFVTNAPTWDVTIVGYEY